MEWNLIYRVIIGLWCNNLQKAVHAMNSHDVCFTYFSIYAGIHISVTLSNNDRPKNNGISFHLRCAGGDFCGVDDCNNYVVHSILSRQLALLHYH